MSESNDMTKEGMLTNKTKEILQLVLQDENQSAKAFSFLKEEFVKKIQGIVPIEKDMATIGTPSVEFTPKLFKQAMELIMRIYTIHYTEIASTFDFIEMVNKNDLETRKNLRALAEALKKNKIQSDEAIQLLIDMFEKRDEKIEHAIKSLNEQQVLNKWIKRHFEDESKEKEEV